MRRLTAILLVLLLARAAEAQPEPAEPPAASQKLMVGTAPVPPFIIKGADGSWSGISIDLWRLLAEKLGLTYEIREYSVPELMAASKENTLDVIISVNITAEREKVNDVTHAFYSTGLAIAVVPRADTSFLTTVRRIFSSRFLQIVLALVVILLVIGLLIWLAERRKNPAQFGGSPMRGIGAGFWWSAVTMTTVGYGDKSPVTVGGRALALIWMFGGVIMISSFTAAISSALTVSQLESPVSGPEDLPSVRVATVAPSAGARYLDRRGVAHRDFKDAAGALDALAAGEVDAVVYESPILRYLARSVHGARISVLGGTFDNHGYGFALKSGSPLREKLNVALLEAIASDAWAQTLRTYLGADAD
ncbi:MAG TPA: transporter substrate-binding domain-containing protein [Kofleriaceae bacterium]|jgi:ABC-type amino acid transport substrate-binding protein